MEKNNPAILEIIAKYKQNLQTHGHQDELYKWELLAKYRGRPNVDALDFGKEIAELDFKNLTYGIASGVLKKLAKGRPEPLRLAIKALYDESRPLSERLKTYDSTTLALYREIELDEKLGHHQDERMAGLLLAYHDPDQYPIYKASFYEKFCTLLDVKPKGKGEKYAHYQSLLKDFIANYIQEDTELLQLTAHAIPDGAYQDPNHLLLAQNILYVMLDQQNDSCNYWLFQVQPDYYDLEAALRENLIDQWTVTQYVDRIRSGDKVILWMTGEEAGCYALAEVTSMPGPRKPAADDIYWTQPDPADVTVDIEITHNFGEEPLLWGVLKNEPEFEDMPRGRQGTNFPSSKRVFETLIRLSGASSLQERTFWLIAPGKGAKEWEEFQDKGCIAIGWSKLGDLSSYLDREDLRADIKRVYQQEGSKKNDTNACWEFAKQIKVGDIVIAKRGTNAYLGWGIVDSNYWFDPSNLNYPHKRNVRWMKVGLWPEEKIVSKTLTSISKYPKYVQRLIEMLEIDLHTNPETKTEMQNSPSPLNQILYGPPGTGKTYHTINKALEILGEIYDPEDRSAQKQIFEKHLSSDRIAFVTFHQSMSYEDFVEGIKPVPPDGNEGSIGYEVQPGIFKNLASKALDNWQLSRSERSAILPFEEALQRLQLEVEENPETKFWMHTPGKEFTITYFGSNSLNFKKASGGTAHNLSYSNIREMYYGGPTPEKTGLGIYYPGVVKKLLSYNSTSNFKNDDRHPLLPHILIIDEINRGNVSQIFGELITLIEEDKRVGAKEALSVTLPYSKETFSVPPNLYIIGTMNTADRSVEALDTALRRRFEFVEMPPKPALVPENLHDASGISPRNILHTINLRIEKLLDREHQIGHAYFMEVHDLKALKNAFQHKLLPLLQEYFFGDYAKIGLVLGKGFVSQANAGTKSAKDFFADFEADHAADLMERQVWHLHDIGAMTEPAFLDAIEKLKPKPMAIQ